MGKLRSLEMFLGLVNIFIALVHLQASPKLSNFGLFQTGLAFFAIFGPQERFKGQSWTTLGRPGDEPR